MALHPSKFTGQDRLQPGSRGETFQVNIPGYRDGADRINRTNNKLNTNAHDVPNIKFSFDDRLPVLFKYGFAFGYNQIVIPKGRIVAVDPNMDLVDFESQKAHNTLTLANGGVPVKVRDGRSYVTKTMNTTDLISPDYQSGYVPGVGKEWEPVIGFDQAYPASKISQPFSTKRAKAQLTDAGLEVNTDTGRVVETSSKAVTTVRPANQPIGIMQRNEYTRDEDAFNGLMPGAVLTDAMVEMPWFMYKDKAEGNPWGSAYGGLFPGALVKSDENGRFVVSPLSFEEIVETMSIAEYEAERQQVVGQVYSVNNDLVPEGAAKYAQWALSDILNFEGFNPAVYKQNGRRGEDAVANSPYKSEGKYPGYPYDPAYMDHDLHMLESYRGTYDQRMAHEYRFDHGIPGLTDGYNAVSTPIEDAGVGTILCPELATPGSLPSQVNRKEKYIDRYFRTRIENVEPGSLEISVGGSAYAKATVGSTFTFNVSGSDYTFLRVKYADELQGIVVLEFFDEEKADEFFGKTGQDLNVSLKYNKRGRAGVPTFLDWDGCIGSVKILLQK